MLGFHVEAEAAATAQAAGPHLHLPALLLLQVADLTCEASLVCDLWAITEEAQEAILVLFVFVACLVTLVVKCRGHLFAERHFLQLVSATLNELFVA